MGNRILAAMTRLDRGLIGSLSAAWQRLFLLTDCLGTYMRISPYDWAVYSLFKELIVKLSIARFYYCDVCGSGLSGIR